MHLNHPQTIPRPWFLEKLSFMKPVPSDKKVGDDCSRQQGRQGLCPSETHRERTSHQADVTPSLGRTLLQLGGHVQLLREDWGEQSLRKREPQLYRDQGLQAEEPARRRSSVLKKRP